MDKRDSVAGPRPRLTLLNPALLSQRCVRGHFAPPPNVAPYVAVTWTLKWALAEGEAFEQLVLPDPCIHIIVETAGAHVLGVVTGAYSQVITGEGFVLGMKFRPGGFCGFVKRAASEFTDRRVALSDVFAGVDALGLERLASSADGAGIRDALESMLWQAGPMSDERIDEVQSIVEWIANDPSLTSVEGLSEASGLSMRTIQRMFQNYVGVSPKWMIRRYRLQEAAARVEAGEVENWAALAQQLGYFDQGHFIREFRRMVGQPPAEYLKRVRAPGGALT